MTNSTQNSPNLKALSFQSVSKKFGQTHPNFPLKEFNLTIWDGEKVLLSGINGVGKTTLLKLAAGYLEPNSGLIHVYGQPVQNQKKQIGLMLQHHFLYWDLTAEENLEFNANLYGAHPMSTSIQLAANTWGLTPFLSKKVGQLSNGQKTLLALARANIHRPELLLLDEPHVYLDESHLQTLECFLRTSKQTVLLTSQTPQLLQKIADRVVQL